MINDVDFLKKTKSSKFQKFYNLKILNFKK